MTGPPLNQWLAGLVPLPAPDSAAFLVSDVNGDNNVSSMDLTLYLMHLFGFIPQFPSQVATASLLGNWRFAVGSENAEFLWNVTSPGAHNNVALFDETVDALVAGNTGTLFADHTYSLSIDAFDRTGTDPFVFQFNTNATIIPAPSSSLLAALGVAMIAWVRRRGRQT